MHDPGGVRPRILPFSLLHVGTFGSVGVVACKIFQIVARYRSYFGLEFDLIIDLLDGNGGMRLETCVVHIQRLFKAKVVIVVFVFVFVAAVFILLCDASVVTIFIQGLACQFQSFLKQVSAILQGRLHSIVPRLDRFIVAVDELVHVVNIMRHDRHIFHHLVHLLVCIFHGEVPDATSPVGRFAFSRRFVGHLPQFEPMADERSELVVIVGLEGVHSLWLA
mmetsp:Transcript_27022/g.76022  ORF Transcript_27022/g.76022 Transcript_27022/m.76022 type:complete len:221 (-) Transcript_27022:124-786(-)